MPDTRTALTAAAVVPAGPALAATVASGAGEGLSPWRLVVALVLVVPGWWAGRSTLSAWWPAAAVALGLGTSAVITAEGWALLNAGMTLVAGVVLPWFAGRYRRRGQDLLAAERERAGRARRDERDRLATEMHDGLGHDLTLLTVRLGALELDGTLAPAHRDEVAALRRRAGDAVERLHDVVDVLDGRDSPEVPDSTAAVRALLAGARDDGLTVRDWDSAGDDLLATLPPNDGALVVRAVREGLTNAARHAPGADVDLALAPEGEHVALTVRNAPGYGTAGSGRAGRGLAELRRVVAARGGSLEAGGDDSGFGLVVRLPRGAS